MKSRFLAPILVVLLVAGCASVPMGDEARDNQLKAFAAPKDKAGVYVYRNESIGAGVKMDVEIDGQPIGQTARRTYLYAELPPGRHVITSKAENTDIDANFEWRASDRSPNRSIPKEGGHLEWRRNLAAETIWIMPIAFSIAFPRSDASNYWSL